MNTLIKSLNIKDVFIIGCGTMGTQLALIIAAKGFNVKLISRSSNSIVKAQKQIESYLENIFWKRFMIQNKVNDFSNISFSTNLDDVKDADIVIECINENIKEKQQLFNYISGLLRSDAIFATNTSTIPLSLITNNENSNLVGIHFFNPIIHTKFVEFSVQQDIPPDVIDKITIFLEALDLKILKLEDRPGMLINRVILPYLLSAIKELEETKLTPIDVDNSLKLACKFSVGPLETTDMIGLDIVLEGSKILYQLTNDCKYLAPSLLQNMVQNGLLGVKSGQGFYNWNQK